MHEARSLVPYPLVEGPNGEVRAKVAGRILPLTQIAAMVLGRAQARRRGPLRATGAQVRHHRPRQLRRQPAGRDEAGGADRRPPRAADRQRAHRRGRRLRADLEVRGQGAGLRPRRRHLRRVDPRGRVGRVPGPGDRRRPGPGRRGLRRGGGAVAARAAPARPARGGIARHHLDAAPQDCRRAGQARPVPERRGPRPRHRPGRSRSRRSPRGSRRQALPRRVRAPGGAAGRSAPWT